MKSMFFRACLGLNQVQEGAVATAPAKAPAARLRLMSMLFKNPHKYSAELNRSFRAFSLFRGKECQLTYALSSAAADAPGASKWH